MTRKEAPEQRTARHAARVVDKARRVIDSESGQRLLRLGWPALINLLNAIELYDLAAGTPVEGSDPSWASGVRRRARIADEGEPDGDGGRFVKVPWGC